MDLPGEGPLPGASETFRRAEDSQGSEDFGAALDLLETEVSLPIARQTACRELLGLLISESRWDDCETLLFHSVWPAGAVVGIGDYIQKRAETDPSGTLLAVEHLVSSEKVKNSDLPWPTMFGLCRSRSDVERIAELTRARPSGPTTRGGLPTALAAAAAQTWDGVGQVLVDQIVELSRDERGRVGPVAQSVVKATFRLLRKSESTDVLCQFIRCYQARGVPEILEVLEEAITSPRFLPEDPYVVDANDDPRALAELALEYAQQGRFFLPKEAAVYLIGAKERELADPVTINRYVADLLSLTRAPVDMDLLCGLLDRMIRFEADNFSECLAYIAPLMRTSFFDSTHTLELIVDEGDDYSEKIIKPMLRAGILPSSPAVASLIWVGGVGAYDKLVALFEECEVSSSPPSLAQCLSLLTGHVKEGASLPAREVANIEEAALRVARAALDSNRPIDAGATRILAQIGLSRDDYEGVTALIRHHFTRRSERTESMSLIALAPGALRRNTWLDQLIDTLVDRLSDAGEVSMLEQLREVFEEGKYLDCEDFRNAFELAVICAQRHEGEFEPGWFEEYARHREDLDMFD